MSNLEDRGVHSLPAKLMELCGDSLFVETSATMNIAHCLKQMTFYLKYLPVLSASFSPVFRRSRDEINWTVVNFPRTDSNLALLDISLFAMLLSCRPSWPLSGSWKLDRHNVLGPKLLKDGPDVLISDLESLLVTPLAVILKQDEVNFNTDARGGDLTWLAGKKGIVFPL